jgi:hypothetical protein
VPAIGSARHVAVAEGQTPRVHATQDEQHRRPGDEERATGVAQVLQPGTEMIDTRPGGTKVGLSGRASGP